jgi:hypothetical protein
MANSSATRRKRWWEAVNLRVGVIAAILGLATTAYSFIKNEVGNKVPVNKDLLPDLKVSYISIAGDIYELADADSVGRSRKKFYWDYPILSNEIANGNRNQTGEIFRDTAFSEQTQFTTCLMIENKGKGDANNISLDLSKINSSQPLNIDESGPTDYDQQIRANHTFQQTHVNLPQSLSTGQGILIPLFISYHPARYTGNGKKWKIASRVIFLPEHIRYKDATDTTQKVMKVRKMQDPVRLEEGIEVRG